MSMMKVKKVVNIFRESSGEKAIYKCTFPYF